MKSLFHRDWPRLAAAVFVVLMASTSELSADLIKLKNGGEIRGQIKSQSGNKTDGTVTIITLSGAEITVDRKDTEFVTRRSVSIEKYETRRKLTPDTADGNWELAEWCRNNNLRKQRATHLERVIELDPKHERAHRGLGHSLRNGKWMSRDDEMKAQGYVKYKGRYITPQELELLEKSASDRKAEQEWFKKIRVWHSWLSGRSNQRRETALKGLQSITDAHAIRGLGKFLGSDKNKQIRSMYVDILKNIIGDESIEPLILTSLSDPSLSIREAALAGIPEEKWEKAATVYATYLTNKFNLVVRRAAKALGEIGTKDAVPELIEALVTTHRYKVVVRGSAQNSYAFSTDGQFGNFQSGSMLPPEVELALRSGQLPYGVIVLSSPSAPENRRRTITIKQEQKNREVLAALEKLTRKNLGYNERTWKLWWASEKSTDGTVN